MVKVSAAAKDGFQAMAVVPVVDGVPDLSHVEIAYAGTNFGGPHDLAADLGVVLRRHSAQCEDALAFADEVEKQFPGATFSTDGHSLGGSQNAAGTNPFRLHIPVPLGLATAVTAAAAAVVGHRAAHEACADR